MCWSKPSQTPPAPTTTMAPTTTVARLDCPTTATKCKDDESFCVNGLCCLPTTGGNKFCVCLENYTGTRCHRSTNVLASMDEMQRAGVIAAFGGFLGVIVIILFVAIIFLQIKFYRHRKKQTALNEREADRMSKPDISRKDSGSRRILRDRPGYSWRESVRHTTSPYQKLQEPLSRSVPEDLFKMGMTLALFGTKGGEEKKNENRNPDALGRCFSAYAGSGGGGGAEEDERGGDGGGEEGENKADLYTGIQESEEIGNNEKTGFKAEDTVT